MTHNRPWTLGFAALSLVLGLAACGDDSTTPGGGGGGSGTDAGSDAADGVSDGSGGGGTDGGTDGGGGATDEEGLYVVFTREVTVPEDPENEYTQLMVADTDCRAPSTEVCEPGSCPLTEIAPRYPDEPLCEIGCRVTPNLSHVVFLDRNNPRTLRVAPLGEDFQLAEDSEVVADEVEGYQLAGQFIAYRIGDRVYLYDLNTGEERQVTQFSNGQGGFHITQDGERLFINSVVSLTAMEMEVYPTNGDPGQPIYDFISGEEQGTGSFFNGREPMAVSPNGDRLAIITNQRNSYAPCGTNADCTAPGQLCLLSASPPRCVAEELTLHVIDLQEENLARLNTLCDDNASCGKDQFCDLTAPDSNGQGRCLPSRFVLGPSGPGACDVFSEGDYTEARPELAWRDDETVVALLGHECTETDIGITDIIAFGLSGQAFQEIEVNPGEDHGGCFDELNSCFDTAECRIEISNMNVSPAGSTIVMVADSFRTSNKNELWLVDGFARFPKQLLTTNIQYEVLQASLHQRDADAE